jgi:hypothetical protein
MKRVPGSHLQVTVVFRDRILVDICLHFWWIILHMVYLQNSKFYRKFTLHNNFFLGTATRDWAFGNVSMQWKHPCCLCSGSCEHLDSGWWLLRKLSAVWQLEMITLLESANIRRNLCVQTRNSGMPLPFFDLKFPHLASRRQPPTCTTTVTFVGYFPMEFSTSHLRCEKMNGKVCVQNSSIPS